MPVDKVQKLINAIDNNKTEFTFPPIINEKLRKLVKIPEPEKRLADELKQAKHELEQIKNELRQTKDELKQNNDELKDKLKDELRELLVNFIKNPNPNAN